MESKTAEDIKKGMHQAKVDLVASMVITKVCIKKLEKTIENTDKLLSKFKI